MNPKEALKLAADAIQEAEQVLDDDHLHKVEWWEPFQAWVVKLPKKGGVRDISRNARGDRQLYKSQTAAQRRADALNAEAEQSGNWWKGYAPRGVPIGGIGRPR